MFFVYVPVVVTVVAIVAVDFHACDDTVVVSVLFIFMLLLSFLNFGDEYCC